MNRVAASTEFPGRPGVRVTGWAYEICGARVVIDGDFSEDEIATFCSRLEASLKLAHPKLRSKVQEIVVPDRERPEGASTATACQTTGQICLWNNRGPLAPHRLPATEIHHLEHECAHLLFQGSGAPDPVEWESAMNADVATAGSRLVHPDVEASDAEDQPLEDWATAVSRLRMSDRDGSPLFRRWFPHRAEIIDRELS